MFVEAGVLVDVKGRPIYWHTPAARTAVSLPDSQVLWEAIWANREQLAGFAHTHPGAGLPSPSHEDITTFAAVDSALGKRVEWWISSADTVCLVVWTGPGKYNYSVAPIEQRDAILLMVPWLLKLRFLSGVIAPTFVCRDVPYQRKRS